MRAATLPPPTLNRRLPPCLQSKCHLNATEVVGWLLPEGDDWTTVRETAASVLGAERTHAGTEVRPVPALGTAPAGNIRRMVVLHA